MPYFILTNLGSFIALERSAQVLLFVANGMEYSV